MVPAQAPPGHGPIHEITPRLAGSPFRGLAGLSDERLVAAAKDGDERAFGVLYERHALAILRYCRSLLRSTQEAEDVKQEVFVLAISALRRGAQPDAFRPWLYRIAHNACMSHLRVRRPVLVADNGVLVGPAAAAEPVDGHREELRQLLDDIGKLPDVQRGALLLREMDGFSYEQVGEVLGLPLSTVRASIFRARRTLQGLAEARDADCEAIQSELTELADRRGRRGRHITSHLTVCPSCRDFRDGLRRRPTVLAGVAPAGPAGALVALKGKLFGGAAAAGGGGGAMATAGGAGVAKIAAVAASSIALLAGTGVEANRAIEHAHRPIATRAAGHHAATTPAVAGPRSGQRLVSPGIVAGSAASERPRTPPVDAGRTAARASARAYARVKRGGVAPAPAPLEHSAPRSANPADTAALSGSDAPAAAPVAEDARHGGSNGEAGRPSDGGSSRGARDHGRAGGDDRTNDSGEQGGRSENPGSERSDDPGAQRSSADGGGGEKAAHPSDGTSGSDDAGAPSSSSSSSPSSNGSRTASESLAPAQRGRGSSGTDSTGSSDAAAPAPAAPTPAAAPAPSAGDPGTTAGAPAATQVASPRPGDATAGAAGTTPSDAGGGTIPPPA